MSGLSSAAFEVYRWSSSKIREGHTEFLFAQIVGHLQSLKTFVYPRTNTELRERLGGASIDWNSCRLSDSEVLDAWGRAIDVFSDPSTNVWALRSAGTDGEFGSSDDVELVSHPTRDP